VVGLMTALGLLDWRPAAGLTGMDLLRSWRCAPAAASRWRSSKKTFLRGAMHTAIERESGTRLAVLLTALFYAATHFFASYHIAPGQVTARSGLELLAGTLHSWAQPAGNRRCVSSRLLAVGVCSAWCALRPAHRRLHPACTPAGW